MTTFFLFIFGLCFGSFLSALAQQKDYKKTDWLRHSVCPFCNHKIAARDLIPLVSFLFLRGRCRHCQKPIGWREPATELLVGLLFVLLGLAHQNTINLLLLRDLVLTFFLVLLFLVDLYKNLLPFKFTLLGMGLALGLNLIIFWQNDSLFFLTYILGAIVCGGFFYLQHLISNGQWVGGGDIGMGLFIGAALGFWFGLWSLGLAYIIGAIFSLILIATKKATLKSQIPFGPFLSIGTWVIIFYLALSGFRNF